MTKKVKEKRGRHLKPKAGLEPRAEKNVTDSPSGNLGRTRRTLLKKTGAATAALATWLLPKQWQKPVIGVVALPTHAQTSPVTPVITIFIGNNPLTPMTSASVVAGGSITITLSAVPAAPNDISLKLLVSTVGATYSQLPDRTDGDYFIESPFERGSQSNTGGGSILVNGRARLPGGATEITMEFVTTLDNDTEPEIVVVGLLGDVGYTPGTIRQVNLTIDPRQPPLPVTTTAP